MWCDFRCLPVVHRLTVLPQPNCLHSHQGPMANCPLLVVLSHISVYQTIKPSTGQLHPLPITSPLYPRLTPDTAERGTIILLPKKKKKHFIRECEPLTGSFIGIHVNAAILIIG